MKCIWCGKKLDKNEIEKNLYYTEVEWNERGMYTWKFTFFIVTQRKVGFL